MALKNIELAIAALTPGFGDYVVICQGGPGRPRWLVIQWLNAGDDEIRGAEGESDDLLKALSLALAQSKRQETR